MFLLDLNPLRIELHHVQSAVGLNKLDWNLQIWAPDPAMNGGYIYPPINGRINGYNWGYNPIYTATGSGVHLVALVPHLPN